MLHVHDGKAGEGSATGPNGRDEAAGPVWVDVQDPTPEDAATALRLTGFALPTLAELSEVEESSRLRRLDGAVSLSLPLVYRDEARRPRITAVGFILSADHLVTLRFQDLKAFGECRERVVGHAVQPSSAAVFAALLEAIVDRLADILEDVGAELDTLAEEVFGKGLGPDSSNRRPKVQDARLRDNLRRVGRSRQLISKVRATLLGIGRIVPFVEGEGEAWLAPEVRARLETVMRDVASLDEFDTHLSDKIQFLLDADLGLINIEQNDRFRILTVVSVVGIPPTLVASLYGMNFKHMPELDWAWGYPYGLALIAVSALVPLAYFRRRGWL